MCATMPGISAEIGSCLLGMARLDCELPVYTSCICVMTDVHHHTWVIERWESLFA
jgi:hypothetical protein